MVAQIAAETLGCSLGRVRVIAADTDLTPIDIGSYSSRVTFMNGNATLRAAEQVKKQIAAAAAKRMDCAPEDLVFREDRVTHSDNRPRVSGVAPAANNGADVSQPTVSGRVEGQILRGSLQQKRKDEGPKESMSFEEAVVAAIDFHGALSGTGSYAPPIEARGGNTRARVSDLRLRTRTPPKWQRLASTKKLERSPFTKSGRHTTAGAL
jgi:4-hydroxybenzoyl-CoA reductase subunit alpha